MTHSIGKFRFSLLSLGEPVLGRVTSLGRRWPESLMALAGNGPGLRNGIGAARGPGLKHSLVNMISWL